MQLGGKKNRHIDHNRMKNNENLKKAYEKLSLSGPRFFFIKNLG